MIVFSLCFLLTFTEATALIEAGANEKGEDRLKELLKTDISLEMRHRALYNLGISYLQRNLPIAALGAFQQMDGLDPFTRGAIQEAYKPQSPPIFDSFPTPLTLGKLLPEISLLLQGLASLPFERGQESLTYPVLHERLSALLEKKKEWWGSVTLRQQELLPKGCDLPGWEKVVKELGLGTLFLRQGEEAFRTNQQPLGIIYPLLEEGYNALKRAVFDLEHMEGKGSVPLRSERLKRLSEMLQRDKTPTPAPVRGEILW